jgi:hypothetical protein
VRRIYPGIGWCASSQPFLAESSLAQPPGEVKEGRFDNRRLLR